MQFTKIIKKELLLEIAIFIFGVAAISFFYNNNTALTILLLVVWSLGIKFWHKIHDIYFYVAGAIIGPIAEIFAIHYGAWHYANPSFLGIPVWLPLAWGMMTMLIKRISETFVKVEMKHV